LTSPRWRRADDVEVCTSEGGRTMTGRTPRRPMRSPSSGRYRRAALRLCRPAYAPLVFIIIATLCVTQPRKALSEQLGFFGAGAQNCSEINRAAIPGKGPGQNTLTNMLFTWVQGYMSGFNGYSYMVNGRTFDLGSASPEAQWEYIVSFCRSNPNTFIVKAIQEMQVRLLKIMPPHPQ
jgi:hypothetical protein